MKKRITKIILALAIVFTVFMGKGSEAKAYKVVNGELWISLNEMLEMTRNGTLGTLPQDLRFLIVDEDALNVELGEMRDHVSEENFDYDWYLQKHPELLSRYGTNKKAIYSFYETTGIHNGWRGRVAFDKLIDVYNFDAARYAADYPDLVAAYGQDVIALYNHYATAGMKEGRKGYSTNETTNAYIKIYEIAPQITNESMTDWEKIKAVHDWMCVNIEYDYDNYVNRTVPAESAFVTGAINKGRATCSGYADTFKAFMDILGIDCICISGTGNGGGHAWNKVEVDGEYYYIDVTWDDPVPDEAGRVLYNYYLTKDPTFGGDHMPREERSYAINVLYNDI